MGMKSRKKPLKKAGKKKTTKPKVRKAKRKVKPGAKRSSKVRRSRVRSKPPELEELFPLISVSEELPSLAASVKGSPSAPPPSAKPTPIAGCTCSYGDGGSESERVVDLFCPIHKSPS